MVGKDSTQTHRPGMQNRLMTQAAQTSMAMHNLNPFSDDNIPEHREEREDGRKGGLAVDDEEGDMIDFETVCEVAHTCATLVRVCNDNDFVSAIDELGRELVDVAFDSSWLWEEEVADHGDIVAHRWMRCCLQTAQIVLISS